MSEQTDQNTPIPFPQEIVDIQEADREKIKRIMASHSERLKKCLEPFVVSRDELDPRISAFEKTLHEINKRRAEHYSREYNPPQILYIDRKQVNKNIEEINKTFMENGLGEFNPGVPKHYNYGNSIVVFVNNFDDQDIEAYYTARSLHHEMNHAGSVRKLKIYYEEDKFYGPYREGGQIISLTKGRLGQAVDEGYHTLEDEVFAGMRPDLKEMNSFLTEIPDADDLTPHGKEKYDALTENLISLGLIEKDETPLFFFHTDSGDTVGSFKFHTKYKELMERICNAKPQIFLAAADFIYGDKMISFARQINRHFGSDFFEKLMSVSNYKDADILLQKLTPNP